jgi:hypothetical protein
MELRNTFLNLFGGTDELVHLLERTVQMTHIGVQPAVRALLALIPNKDTLHEELKHIIMGLPYEALWKALETMYILRWW